MKKIKTWFDLSVFGISTLVGLVIGGIFFSLIVISPLYNQFVISDFFLEKTLKKTSDSWQDTDVVKSLSYLCNLNLYDYDKIECVYYFIAKNTNYGTHSFMNMLRQPDEIFNKTVVCRDMSVLADSVYSKMGYKTEIVNIDEHVYNKVYYDNTQCKVDITNWKLNCSVETFIKD